MCVSTLRTHVSVRQVLGVAAMRPAAALLVEALGRMQWRERELLLTELDEPHDGWLRYIIENDHVYKEACTEAMQVQTAPVDHSLWL